MRSLIAALRFLTRVPVPGRPTQAEDLSSAVGWFPLVGALVGVATAGVYTVSRGIWPAPVAAVVAIAFGLLLTGGFHEDGLTDATDGLGGGWTRERVLEIMKDSRIGAYGAMALWCLLALRFAAMVSLDRNLIRVLPLAMLWGRWSIAMVLKLLPPIGQGLAKEVHEQSGWKPLLGATALLILGLLLSWLCHVPRLVPMSLAGLGASLFWAGYLKRRLGGHSGDLLGAGTQVVEALVLLAGLVREQPWA